MIHKPTPLAECGGEPDELATLRAELADFRKGAAEIARDSYSDGVKIGELTEAVRRVRAECERAADDFCEVTDEKYASRELARTVLKILEGL